MKFAARMREYWDACGPAPCRDKGWSGADAGALCLSSLDDDDPARSHITPTDSPSDEDKHKSPSPPYIRPLSLQDGGGRFPSLCCSVAKVLQGRCPAPTLVYITSYCALLHQHMFLHPGQKGFAVSRDGIPGNIESVIATVV